MGALLDHLNRKYHLFYFMSNNRVRVAHLTFDTNQIRQRQERHPPGPHLRNQPVPHPPIHG